MADYEGPVYDGSGSYLGEWDGVEAPIGADSTSAYGDGGAGYVGEWPETSVPSSGSGWEGIAALVVGIVFAIFVGILVGGFREARRGNYGKALLYWSVPIILLSYGLVQAASDHVAKQERGYQRELYQQESQAVAGSPGNYFSFERIRGDVEPKDCGSICQRYLYGEYLISSNTARVRIPIDYPGCIKLSDERNLEPGQTLTFYCQEQFLTYGSIWEPIVPCISVGGSEVQHTMCIDPFEDFQTGYLAQHFEFETWLKAHPSGRLKTYARIRYTGTSETLFGEFFIEGNEDERIGFLEGSKSAGGFFELMPNEEKTIYTPDNLAGKGRICAKLTLKGRPSEI